MSNKQLPADVQLPEEIKQKLTEEANAYATAKVGDINTIAACRVNEWEKAADGWEDGATVYASKLHQVETHNGLLKTEIKHLNKVIEKLTAKVNELEAAGSEASGYIEFLDVQNNRLRKPLFELVRLKDRKDEEGNFIGYERLKQIAWEEAREVVKDLNNPTKLTQERADLIREANNRGLDGAAANELQQELALSKEVNKEALALTEKAQLQLQDLRDKGDMLAIAARQLAFSMEVHSDYEPNSEFFDRVQGVWKAVAEWSGEKEVNVSWGGTQPATILVHCTDKSCPYCHGTGKVKIESQTTGRISYADHYSNGSISFSTEKEVKGEGK